MVPAGRRSWGLRNRGGRGGAALGVALALAVAVRGRAARAEEDAFRAEAGPFYATFSDRYGRWFGGAGRLWLLDSEGTRGLSGYLNVVDLHWVPEPVAGGPERIHSTFVMARVMRNWSPGLYTMTTVGGTAFDAVFPRVQVETELNGLPPQVGGSVLTFGAGDRYYPLRNRPYLVFGASYATRKTSFSYRLWVGRGLARERSVTQLFTWAYGARLDYWVRLELLWGDESHARGGQLDVDVDSRGLTLTFEKWLTRSLGVSLSPEITEISLRAPGGGTLHRFQTSARLFVTF